MQDQPIADARLQREAEFLANKFGGRSVSLTLILKGERRFWRAEILPTDATIALRLGLALKELSEPQIAMVEFMAIAVGEGATQAEALKALQPVKWEFPDDRKGAATPL